MKISITKKIVPVISSAVAVSFIYMGMASADTDTNTIYITDINDVIEIGEGYYPNSVSIKTDLVDNKTITADKYEDGSNDTLLDEPLTEETTLTLTDEHGAYNTYDLGPEEQLSIQPGFYYSGFNIRNGVTPRDSFDVVFDAPGPYSVTLEEGYYKSGSVIMSPTIEQFKTAMKTLLKEKYGEDMTFAQIATTLNAIDRNPIGSVTYEKNESEASTGFEVTPDARMDAKLVDETVTGEGEKQGQTLSLGIDEKLTVPAGYYTDDFTIKNGVSDRGDPTAIINGNNKKIDLKEGYYTEGSITLSESWGDLITAINSIFATEFTGDETFAEVAEGIGGPSFSKDNRGVISFNKNTASSSTRAGTTETNPTLVDIPLADQTITLGVNESLEIPQGYYSKKITVTNGDTDRGSPAATLDGNMQQVSLPEGYYEPGDIKMSDTWFQLVAAINNTLGTTLSGYESFADIATTLAGDMFNLDNGGVATYTPVRLGSSTRLGTSDSVAMVTDIPLSNQILHLGVDETLTIPEGYYSYNITITNGVVDRQSPYNVLDGNRHSVTLPEGYYEEGTIEISDTWYTMIHAINTTLGTTFNGGESFSEIAEIINLPSFNFNNAGTAYYTPKTIGTNTRVGTSSDIEELSSVILSGQVIDLGIDETLVIPEGYYDENITIRNGVLHRDNIDTTVSAFNNPLKGGSLTTTGSAGYYDSITVSDATPDGWINKKSLNGTIKTWNASSSTWR